MTKMSSFQTTGSFDAYVVIAMWASYSPDGERILYVGANEALDDMQLAVMDADGTEATTTGPPPGHQTTHTSSIRRNTPGWPGRRGLQR
jgi:hypothetical protein